MVVHVAPLVAVGAALRTVLSGVRSGSEPGCPGFKSLLVFLHPSLPQFPHLKVRSLRTYETGLFYRLNELVVLSGS